jgi:enhancer of polycomb-like protein
MTIDADDEPSVGPNGPDEKDGVLIDEFHPKYVHLGSEDLSSLTALLRYLLKGMSLYQEDDHQQLTTDPTIYTPSSDGCLFGFLPYRMGIAPAFCCDAIIVGPRPHGTQTPQATAAQQHQQQLAQQQQQQQSTLGMPQTTGTPISMQQQLKKLPSVLNIPQMRISSNSNLHPLATPVLTMPLTSPQSSPMPTAANGQTSPVPPSLNGSEESTPAPQ